MSITQPGSTPFTHTAHWQTLSSSTQLLQELSTWKVGDTQSARVQTVLPENQNAPAGSTRVVLNIGGRLVTATLPLVVRVGDQLEMTLRTNQEVLLRLSTGLSATLALKTLASTAAPAPSLSTLLHAAARYSQASRTAPLDTALGRLLPFQGRLLDTLSALLQLQPSRANADLSAVLAQLRGIDRKSTRLNSSHVKNSYAVFCLKKKKHNKES